MYSSAQFELFGKVSDEQANEINEYKINLMKSTRSLGISDDEYVQTDNSKNSKHEQKQNFPKRSKLKQNQHSKMPNLKNNKAPRDGSRTSIPKLSRR